MSKSKPQESEEGTLSSKARVKNTFQNCLYIHRVFKLFSFMTIIKIRGNKSGLLGRIISHSSVTFYIHPLFLRFQGKLRAKGDKNTTLCQQDADVLQGRSSKSYLYETHCTFLWAYQTTMASANIYSKYKYLPKIFSIT